MVRRDDGAHAIKILRLLCIIGMNRRKQECAELLSLFLLVRLIFDKKEKLNVLNSYMSFCCFLNKRFCVLLFLNFVPFRSAMYSYLH